MKKSKSMFETPAVYSGDDEGFESSPEKIVSWYKIEVSLIHYWNWRVFQVNFNGNPDVNGNDSPPPDTTEAESDEPTGIPVDMIN